MSDIIICITFRLSPVSQCGGSFPWWLFTVGAAAAPPFLIQVQVTAHPPQTPQQPQKPWCEDVFVHQAIQHAIGPIPDLSNIGQLGGQYGFYYASKWWITRQALKAGASATGSIASRRLGTAAAGSFWVGFGFWADISLGEALYDEVNAQLNGQCR